MCESAQEKGSVVGWKLLCDASFGSWGLFACLSGSLSAWSCIRGEQFSVLRPHGTNAVKTSLLKKETTAQCLKDGYFTHSKLNQMLNLQKHVLI